MPSAATGRLTTASAASRSTTSRRREGFGKGVAERAGNRDLGTGNREPIPKAAWAGPLEKPRDAPRVEEHPERLSRFPVPGSHMSYVRDGLRMVRRSPGIAALASLALALGIGSTTTMYSITRGILRELPVDQPDRLIHVAVTDRTAGDDYLRIPVADIAALREQQRSFQSLAAYEDVSIHLGDAQHRAERLSSALVTASLFSVLRASPLIGRMLSADDERPGAPPVAVLGHTLWKNRYAG